MHSGCLSALRVRLESIKGGAVGELIKTGVSIGGHSSTISYQDYERGRTATLTCECGWSAPLKSADKPWAIIEVQRRFEAHLPDELRDPAAQPTGDPGLHEVSADV